MLFTTDGICGAYYHNHNSEDNFDSSFNPQSSSEEPTIQYTFHHNQCTLQPYHPVHTPSSAHSITTSAHCSHTIQCTLHQNQCTLQPYHAVHTPSSAHSITTSAHCSYTIHHIQCTLQLHHPVHTPSSAHSIQCKLHPVHLWTTKG